VWPGGPIYMLVVISGLSGSGKDTVIKYLLEDYGWKRHLSYTTRPERKGEVNGIDYRFVSNKEFFKLRKRGELLDCVCISGYYYGFPLNELIQKIKDDKNYVMSLVPESGLALKKIIEETKLIYLTLPSVRFQIERLRGRGMTNSEISIRLKNDPNWQRKPFYYDLEILNIKSKNTAKFIAGLSK